MNRTLDDLRSTLQLYGDELPPSSARTLGVHKRIRRLCHQRFVAVAAAIALVAGVGTLGVRAARTTDQTAAKSHVPEYAFGGRLVAPINLDSRVGGSASVTIAVPTKSLILSAGGCGKGSDHGAAVSFLVNGKEAGAGGCSASFTMPFTPSAQVTVEFRLTRGVEQESHYLSPAELAGLPRIRVFGGIYLPVPRSEYHFPPRPAKPAPLEALVYPGIAINGLTDKTQTVTANLGSGLDLHLAVSAPGVISIELDGKEVSRWSVWDYTSAQNEITQTPAELTKLGVTGPTAALTLTFQDFPTPPVQWSAVLSR